jgi:hypothetical protein
VTTPREFKSPPQRNFHIFPGEQSQNVKKRFELLNTGTTIVKSFERRF